MTRKLQAAPTLERKTFELHVKAEDERAISGYANVYNITDSVGDIVEPGAFKRSLANDDIRPLLWQHDSYALIGDGTFSEDATGLKLVEGRLYEGVQQADEAYAIAKQARFKLGLSVGFSIPKGGSYEDDDGIRHITEAKLYETSVVTWPANEESRIESVKAAAEAAPTFTELVDATLEALPADPSDEEMDKAHELAAVIVGLDDDDEPEPAPEMNVGPLLAQASAASALASLV